LINFITLGLYLSHGAATECIQNSTRRCCFELSLRVRYLEYIRGCIGRHQPRVQWAVGNGHGASQSRAEQAGRYSGRAPYYSQALLLFTIHKPAGHKPQACFCTSQQWLAAACFSAGSQAACRSEALQGPEERIANRRGLARAKRRDPAGPGPGLSEGLSEGLVWSALLCLAALPALGQARFGSGPLWVRPAALGQARFG
jgi:hypothetical protein